MRKILFSCVALFTVLALTLVPTRLAAQSIPAVGQPAPSFDLVSQTGATVSLANYKGKYVVLFFYPKDMANGSTAEVKAFQADLEKYQKYGVVLGISVGTPAIHKQFATQTGVTFPLLSDPDGGTAKAYGSLATANGTPVAVRNTFLIDPQGKIAKVWTNVTNPAAHSALVSHDLSLKPPIITSGVRDRGVVAPQ